MYGILQANDYVPINESMENLREILEMEKGV